jgi:hypothetical protein
VRDEADVLDVVAQRLEGRGIARIERERGKKVPARLQVCLARECGAALLHALGHFTLDARLETPLHRADGRIGGIDRERDRPLRERGAERALFLQRLRLLTVRSGQRFPRRGRPHRDRAFGRRGARRRGGGGAAGGGAAGEREHGGGG